MAPAWAGDRAAGSAVSLSTPVMTTAPRKLNSKPKDRATRVAAWLTGFPAAAPSSSSHASQRLVTWIRSAHPVPMSALRERMNRVPPPGRSTSLGGPSTGMRRAFTACPRAVRGTPAVPQPGVVRAGRADGLGPGDGGTYGQAELVREQRRRNVGGERGPGGVTGQQHAADADW